VESPTFAALSKDSLRALTVEAVLAFVRQAAPCCSIRKIACIELPSQQQAPDSAVSPGSPAAAAAAGGPHSRRLLPGAGDSMAQAVLQFLEQQVVHRAAAGSAVASKRSAAESPSPSPSSPSILGDGGNNNSVAGAATSPHLATHIVSCNVPLPVSFYRSAQAFSCVFGWVK
jgi:hypothetical protein